MKLITVTFTLAQKIEREAKRRRKENPDRSRASFRDEVARENGFLHWHHVCLCRGLGHQQKKRIPLTPRLQRILAEAKTRFPVSTTAQQAFDDGIIVAVDVANIHKLNALKFCVEVPDVWHLAARDIWPASLFGRQTERPKEDESVLDLKVMDDFTSLHFFAIHSASKDDTALKSLTELQPTPIQWFWNKGKATRVTQAPWVGPDRPRLERFWHLIDPVSRSFIGNESPAMANDSAFQFEKATPLGQLRYQAISTSVSMPWKDAQPVHSA